METLKEFRAILLGHPISSFKDRNNLMYEHYTTEIVILQCLLLEYYGPIFRYINVPHNDTAGALIRLLINNSDVKEGYIMLEFVGIISSQDFLDLVKSKMYSNAIYCFEFQTLYPDL